MHRSEFILTSFHSCTEHYTATCFPRNVSCCKNPPYINTELYTEYESNESMDPCVNTGYFLLFTSSLARFRNQVWYFSSSFDQTKPKIAILVSLHARAGLIITPGIRISRDTFLTLYTVYSQAW